MRLILSLMAWSLALGSVQAQTPPAQPLPCAAKEYRAFDFWVGEWDVFGAAGQRVAASKIELMFGGCAIRETWMPLSGAGGGSFSGYDRDHKQWRQAWVDGFGGRVDFDGGVVDGKMVLTGLWRHANGPGRHAPTRMIYSANADGSVRQHGEQSNDQGLTWSTSFDFTYRPRKTAGAKP